MTIKNSFWGQHLILDFKGCPKEMLTDKDHILSWVDELIIAIEMKAYGDPIIKHFATHSNEAAGYTLMQMIETSNICAHFAENIGEVYIDIFSCKEFNNDIAMEVCEKYFQPSDIKSTIINRGGSDENES